MNEIESMTKYAAVGVRPVGTLKETAALLGEVLSGLEFEEDVDGVYDEYPSFLAFHDGCRYALLGNPAHEDDIREGHNGDFSLLVEPFDDASNWDSDVSSELVSIMSSDGRLSSYVLE